MASLTNQKLSCLNSVKRSEEGTRPKTVRQPAVILFEYIGDRSGLDIFNLSSTNGRSPKMR